MVKLKCLTEISFLIYYKIFSNLFTISKNNFPNYKFIKKNKSLFMHDFGTKKIVLKMATDIAKRQRE